MAEKIKNWIKLLPCCSLWLSLCPPPRPTWHKNSKAIRMKSPKRSSCLRHRQRTHFAWLRNVRMGDLELAGSDQTSGSSQSLESHFPERGKRKRMSAYSYHSYPFASDCICNLQFLAGSLSVPPRPSTRSWLSKLARKWVHFRSELRSHPILAARLTSANQLAREVNSFLLMASR